MKREILSALVLFTAVASAPFAASAQGSPTAPTFVGQAVGDNGAVYQVEATLREVGLVDGELVAQAVDYTVVDTATGDVLSGASDAALAIGSNASCSILLLDVQPIFLDLLGLQLQTSEIVIDLSAVAGQGRLLGNLLCIVTGLLDGPGVVIQAILNIIAIINDILGSLS